MRKVAVRLVHWFGCKQCGVLVQVDLCYDIRLKVIGLWLGVDFVMGGLEKENVVCIAGIYHGFINTSTIVYNSNFLTRYVYIGDQPQYNLNFIYPISRQDERRSNFKIRKSQRQTT